MRAINTLAFLSGHCLPFILTGQEFGAENRPSIHGRLHPIGKTRRVGFVVPASAGLQIPPEGGTTNRVREEAAVEVETNIFARTPATRAAWFEFYRQLIQLRLKQPALQRGSFDLIDVGEDAPRNQRTVVAFERKLGRWILRCAINMGDQPRKLSRAEQFGGMPVYGSLSGGEIAAFGAIVVRVAG